MRRWLFLALFAALLGSCMAASGLMVAYAQPFSPGHPLYRVQRAAQAAVLPVLPPDVRFAWDLYTLERHIEWISQTAGTAQEPLVLQSLVATLNQTLQDLNALPPAQRRVYQQALGRRLLALQRAAQQAAQRPNAQQDAWASLEAQLSQASRALLQGRTIVGVEGQGMTRPSGLPAQVAPTGTPHPTVTPLGQGLPVPFPTDFAARHTFFPLTGRHGQITCESCHVGGRFAGTPRSCQTCHAQDKPPNHFQGECSLCHGTQAWLPASFDHKAAGATDCISCHLKDRPPNHFQGQCSLCHSTQAWLPANFNHQAAGATDCISCHLKDRPPNHFQGQCSLCHSTRAWLPANFNHTFPINHGGANGVCSVCHPTSTAAYTCTGCHDMAAMQAEHAEEGIFNIAGRCAACHATGQAEGGEDFGDDDDRDEGREDDDDPGGGEDDDDEDDDEEDDD